MIKLELNTQETFTLNTLLQAVAEKTDPKIENYEKLDNISISQPQKDTLMSIRNKIAEAAPYRFQ